MGLLIYRGSSKLRWFPLRGRDPSTGQIRFPLSQHVPDDRGQLPHNRHSGDAGSPSAFDAIEPFPQSSVLAQGLLSYLRQEPPRHTTTSFGNATQPLGLLAAVSTPWREPPIVG